MCLTVCMSVCISVCLSVFAGLSVCLPACLSVYLSASVRLSVCLCVLLSVTFPATVTGKMTALLSSARFSPQSPMASHVFHYRRPVNDRETPLSAARPLYFAAIWPPFNSAAFLLLNCYLRHCCTACERPIGRPESAQRRGRI